MIILLSPSKTLDFTSNIPKYINTIPDFLEESRKLVAILKKKKPQELSELMGISEKLADLNAQRYQDFKTPFTEKNARQAIFAFKGDVYEGIEVEYYKKPELDFAQKHLRILSGLYGLLRPLDLIQPYRLEMGIALKNPKGKNLYEFWDNNITDALNAGLESQTSPLLINLASNEYFSAINERDIKGKIIHVAFKEKKGADYKIIGLFAKQARGKMANFIIKNKIDSVKDIPDFCEDGYRFNKKFSDEKHYVFVRG